MQNQTPPPEPSLEELLARCPKDPGALERLYRSLHRKVFAFAFSLLQDTGLAEDCMQETFIRLPSAAARYTPKQAGMTFILAICKNVTRETLRNRGRFPVASEDFDLRGGGDFTEAVILRDLLGKLGKKQRQIVVLHHYGGLTFTEIGKLLRTPASTVKSRYSRALTLLREACDAGPLAEPINERMVHYGILGK